MSCLSFTISICASLFLFDSTLAINFLWSKSEAEQRTETALKENPGFNIIYYDHKEMATGSNLLYNPQLENETAEVYLFEITIEGLKNAPGVQNPAELWEKFFVELRKYASPTTRDTSEDTKKKYYEALKCILHIISPNSKMAFAKTKHVRDTQYKASIYISPPLSDSALESAFVFKEKDAIFLLNSCRQFFNREPVAVDEKLTTTAKEILATKIVSGSVIKTFPYTRLTMGFKATYSLWIYKLPKEIDPATIWLTYPVITMYQLLFNIYPDSKTKYSDGSIWTSNNDNQFYCQIRRDIYILMNTETRNVGIAHQIFAHDGNKYATMVITYDKNWKEPNEVDSNNLPIPVFLTDIESPTLKDKVMTVANVLQNVNTNLELRDKLILQLPKLPDFDFKANMIIFDPTKFDKSDMYKYSPTGKVK